MKTWNSKIGLKLYSKGIQITPERFLIGRMGKLIARRMLFPNITNGQKDYQRFLILTQRRSGSNLLVSTLNSHSQIVCEGELFAQEGPYFGYHRNETDIQWLRKIRNEGPQQFLDELIYRSYNKQIHTVGFKVFPNHLNNPLFNACLRNIVESEDTLLIHLRRRNFLAAHLSHMRAAQSNIWISTNGSTTEEQPIFLSADLCNKAFRYRKLNEKYLDQLCKNRDHLRITYEDIVEDFNDSMEQIQLKLGVDIEQLRPLISKQSTLGLRESIANFDELKMYFAETQWAKYFSSN